MRTPKALVFFGMLVLVVACSEHPLTQDDPTPNTDLREAFVETNEDIGGLHNAILVAYDERHPLSDPTPVTIDYMAETIASAASEVLGETYTRADVLAITDVLDNNSPDFDFWGTEVSSPFDQIDFLHANGHISASEKQELYSVLLSLHGSSAAAGPDYAALSDISKSTSSPVVWAGAEVAAASAEFWSQQFGGGPLPSDTRLGGPARVNWEFIGRAVSDALGVITFAAMFPYVPVPAALVTAVASISFHVMATSDPPGDYTVPRWADPLL